MFSRFRGVEIEAQTGPETASGREALGLRAIWWPFWVPKSIRKGIPKPADFWTVFGAAQSGDECLRPVFGRLLGRFWPPKPDLPGADLDVLDDVCGAQEI